jgi:predicted Zn finger-like uncharacterized protein
MSDSQKILSTCTSCSTNYRIPAEKIGKKVKCPRCGTVFIVQAQPSQAPPNRPILNPVESRPKSWEEPSKETSAAKREAEDAQTTPARSSSYEEPEAKASNFKPDDDDADQGGDSSEKQDATIIGMINPFAENPPPLPVMPTPLPSYAPSPSVEPQEHPAEGLQSLIDDLQGGSSLESEQEFVQQARNELPDEPSNMNVSGSETNTDSQEGQQPLTTPPAYPGPSVTDSLQRPESKNESRPLVQENEGTEDVVPKQTPVASDPIAQDIQSSSKKNAGFESPQHLDRQSEEGSLPHADHEAKEATFAPWLKSFEASNETKKPEGQDERASAPQGERELDDALEKERPSDVMGDEDWTKPGAQPLEALGPAELERAMVRAIEAATAPENNLKPTNAGDSFAGTQTLVALLMRLLLISGVFVGVKLIFEFLPPLSAKPWTQYVPGLLIVLWMLFGLYLWTRTLWRRAREASDFDSDLATALAQLSMALGEIVCIGLLVHCGIDVTANWLGGPNMINVLDAQLDLPFMSRTLDFLSLASTIMVAGLKALICITISYSLSKIVLLLRGVSL